MQPQLLQLPAPQAPVEHATVPAGSPASPFCWRLALATSSAFAAGAAGLVEPPAIAGIPVDFLLFAATLIGVAVFHHHTLYVALTGLVVITLYKILASPFPEGAGVAGFLAHLAHEWVLLANLLGLLLGFALLSKHFEASQVPAWLPRFLPNDWKGAFVLLVMIFVLSSFLDNIAAAMIGGTIAHVVFRGKVHLGYLAAIVAASNAGGSGSVVGDTTTTMMWIDGVAPSEVFEAYVGASCRAGPLRYSRCTSTAALLAHPEGRAEGHHDRLGPGVHRCSHPRDGSWRQRHRERQIQRHLRSFPVHRRGVWVALLVCLPLRRPHWEELPSAFRGSVFLLSLVLAASMMPVQKLPDASWMSALGLGFISAVFDNIPLTALALHQGGYDWGFLAYAVGFGGSMVWFGSSAGVALTNQYPEARSAVAWVRAGWHVIVAYVIGFIVMLVVVGWHPEPKHKASPGAQSAG